MEILDYRVLLPAVVQCKQMVDVSSQETSVVTKEERVYDLFVYIDHVNKDVILTDVPGGLDDHEKLRKAIYDHVISKRTRPFVPPTPSEGFTKLKPESYMNNENG